MNHHLVRDQRGVVKKCVRRFAGAVAALTVLAGCAGGSSEAQDREVVSAAALGATIIDVRTPEEFAEGHLEGAMLINVQDPSFDSTIATLDPNASYIVYCRSGNRSAQAVQRMREAGIANITDLGSLQNASSKTGVAIVTG